MTDRHLPGYAKPPFAPGEDITGIVAAVGDGATSVQIGQRVAGWAPGEQGGYTEEVCWPANDLVAVPDVHTTGPGGPRSGGSLWT